MTDADPPLSRQHPRVKRLARLARSGRTRDEEGAYLLEGPTIVGEAIALGIGIEGVYVEEGTFAELADQARARSIPIHRVSPGALERALSTTTPQPVAAVATVPAFDLGQLLDRDPTLLLVLDAVSDPGNLGALVRSAEAGGVDGLVVGETSADPRQPKVVRASAGSILRTAVVEHPAPDALRELGLRRVQRVGAVADGGRAPDQVDLTRPTALVLGSEAHGLSPAVLDRLDEVVTIPMGGDTQSLNVAAAGAVLIFEAVRQRRADDRSATAIEVISAVSHELRSPLTAIRGFSSLLSNRWDRLGDDEKHQMIDEISRESIRVTRLVGELLDISRLESGRLRLQRRLLRIGDLIPAVLDKIRLEFPELECTVGFPDDLPLVSADADKLEQVLTNLVENAAKYGSVEGLCIDASAEDGELQVAVRDQGEGIPPEDLDRLFSKYYRRDGQRPSGTGLGLWISRGLVEAHGGRLTASSVPGEGSTFTLHLPAYEE